MKPKSLWVAAAVTVILIISLVIAEIAFSAPWKGWRGSGGWGMGTPYQRLYNPARVENLAGEVLSIEKASPMRGMNYGIYLIVKGEKETLPVHLGPDWYIARIDMKFAVGDKVEIKGSRVDIAGKPAFIAAEIKTGDKVLILRDGAGVPVWSGWGWKR